MRKPLRKRAKPKRNTFKKIVFSIFTVCILIFTLFVMAVERRLLPTVIEITKIRAEDKINAVIADTINTLVSNGQIQSSDFYIKSVDQNGKIQSLEVNTILIDSLCADIAAIVSSELSGVTVEVIEVPVGAMLGISGMSNFGPSYSVRVKPMGSATVDYASAFESAGINQINFQIWLDVNSKIQIVNPIQNTEVLVQRKILLVNTVFSGEVPAMFIDK